MFMGSSGTWSGKQVVSEGEEPLTNPPPLCSYFGFITKHPLLSRFACHVFVSQESMRAVAQSVG